MNRRPFAACLCLTLASVLPGVAQDAARDALAQPPVVPVSKPVERTIIDYEDFTGRTSAVHMVDIKARVTGYMVRAPFKEGSLVKKGDILFEIDSRPYKAELDAAAAQVLLAKASLEIAQKTLERDLVVRSMKGAVSDQQIDQERSAVVEAEARVRAGQGSLEILKLNLDFCIVKSPIDGRVGRYHLTVGNLVNKDTTALTTVVSENPMFVYFDMDERTLLRLKGAVKEKQIKPPQDDAKFALYLGLGGEEGFPHKGTLDFVNNQVNPDTGTISLRGVFANPELTREVRLLVPGMFGRIRMSLNPPHAALLVIDRAIASDQGVKYVYVIDAQNKAQYRRVTTGQLQPDGLRAITDGLKPREWVAVGALKLIRPNMQIQTEKITMPMIVPSAEAKK